MSDESVEPKKTVKRVTVKSPRKTAAEKLLASEKAAISAEETRRDEVVKSPTVVAPHKPAKEEAASQADEIQPSTVGAEAFDGRDSDAADAGKRTNKRRRKKKKQHEYLPSPENGRSDEPRGENPRSSEQTRSESPREAGSRHKPEHLNKMAWKIFLAEVSEEGLALIPDQHAREISRRSFRLAEIFLDEQARRSR